MRIKLWRAMAATAFGTFCLAALCRSSYLTTAAALSFTLLLLIYASIRARCRTRSFWRGFSLAGWIYLALHLGPFSESTIGRQGVGAALADLAYASIGPQSWLVAGREGRMAGLANVQYLRPAWVWNAWSGWENGLGPDRPFCPTTYLLTVHCLLALAVAWLGGWVDCRHKVHAA